MNFLRNLTAASIVVLSAAASAEQPLTSAQMDGVSAGGSALAEAVAQALGNVATTTQTATTTTVQAVSLGLGQLGAIFDIQSVAQAGAASTSDGTAIAVGEAVGATQGSLLSDTASVAQTFTDTTAPLPVAAAAAANTSIAASILFGFPTAAQSTAASAAALANPT